MKKLFLLAAAAMVAASVNAATVYVDNQVGYDPAYLYAWGDDNTILGEWPGTPAQGTATVDGVTYQKFELPAQAVGMQLYFIFNMNTKQVEGFDTVVEDKDYYLTATAAGLSLAGSGNQGGGNTDEIGATVLVDNAAGYASSYLYAWCADNNPMDPIGAWPGLAAVGTETYQGVVYQKFELPASVIGLTLNFIYNNGVGGGTDQVEGFTTTVENKTYYLTSADGYLKISGTATPMTKLYVLDNSGWDALYVYGWNGGGAPELFGGWPGAALTEEVTLEGKTYKVLNVVESVSEYNLIFNNGDAEQFDAEELWTPNAPAAYEVTATGVSSIAVPNDASVVVDVVAAPAEAPVYFTLQGVKVANPEKGLYIKVCAGKATKVIL